MSYVPAGEFVMGSSDQDIVNVLAACADCKREWFTDEQPPHAVKLHAFWLDQTEVTNAEFALFLSAQGNQVEGSVPWLDLGRAETRIEQTGDYFQATEAYAEHPVVGVSWFGARAYCRWVDARLPTEAEWEYAARGPEGHIYPWGDEFNCAGGNFSDSDTGCGDGHPGLAPIGSFPEGKSWSGVLDMAGNAGEWTADFYEAGYYARSPSENPPGPGEGQYRTPRGGAYNVGQWGVRGAHRYWNLPTDRGPFVGFRCVVSDQ
jgi:formylglycine-generating enzyme required for sulfatase activity